MHVEAHAKAHQEDEPHEQPRGRHEDRAERPPGRAAVRAPRARGARTQHPHQQVEQRRIGERHRGLDASPWLKKASETDNEASTSRSRLRHERSRRRSTKGDDEQHAGAGSTRTARPPCARRRPRNRGPSSTPPGSRSTTRSPLPVRSEIRTWADLAALARLLPAARAREVGHLPAAGALHVRVALACRGTRGARPAPSGRGRRSRSPRWPSSRRPSGGRSRRRRRDELVGVGLRRAAPLRPGWRPEPAAARRRRAAARRAAHQSESGGARAAALTARSGRGSWARRRAGSTGCAPRGRAGPRRTTAAGRASRRGAATRGCRRRDGRRRPSRRTRGRAAADRITSPAVGAVQRRPHPAQRVGVGRASTAARRDRAPPSTARSPLDAPALAARVGDLVARREAQPPARAGDDRLLAVAATAPGRRPRWPAPPRRRRRSCRRARPGASA